MLENTLNDMVDNENVEVPYFFLAIEEVEFGYKEEDSGSTMDEGMPSTEAPMDPFQQIMKLEAELAASKALVEEYKAKVAKLE
jgi:hypothetical protein